jgi:hypothetical protein
MADIIKFRTTARNRSPQPPAGDSENPQMSAIDLMNWLTLACEAKGAAVRTGEDGPDHQAAIAIELEGHDYVVSICTGDDDPFAAAAKADDADEALLLQLVQMFKDAAANAVDPAVTERINKTLADIAALAAQLGSADRQQQPCDMTAAAREARDEAVRQSEIKIRKKYGNENEQELSWSD